MIIITNPYKLFYYEDISLSGSFILSGNGLCYLSVDGGFNLQS